jgi:regulator of protease activity HflC (stomatin/prohibitin superfamily)
VNQCTVLAKVRPCSSPADSGCSSASSIARRVQGYGLEVESVGVKDIILSGEMKVILAKMVEAEKVALANVIRRREETSATRSLLNTARVMEDNPIALRLKELETLEKRRSPRRSTRSRCSVASIRC